MGTGAPRNILCESGNRCCDMPDSILLLLSATEPDRRMTLAGGRHFVTDRLPRTFAHEIGIEGRAFLADLALPGSTAALQLSAHEIIGVKKSWKMPVRFIDTP